MNLDCYHLAGRKKKFQIKRNSFELFQIIYLVNERASMTEYDRLDAVREERKVNWCFQAAISLAVSLAVGDSNDQTSSGQGK